MGNVSNFFGLRRISELYTKYVLEILEIFCTIQITNNKFFILFYNLPIRKIQKSTKISDRVSGNQKLKIEYEICIY